jgi:peptidoglycan/LPS O-acetylase OafA/YrhL
MSDGGSRHKVFLRELLADRSTGIQSMRHPFGLTENPRRNPHIDLLRGFSIFVVLFTHFGGACGPFSESVLISTRLVKGLGQNSYYGVSMFFVISGFLITSTTLQRYGKLGAVSIPRFFRFRISRILPPLLLLVTLNLAGYVSGWPGFEITEPVTVPRLLAYVFTFRFNLLYLRGGAVLAAWAVLWSLAIEEVFYLAFPLLCRLVRNELALAAVFLGFLVLGPYYRATNGWSGIYLYGGCFDQLAMGCLTAIAARRWQAGTWSVTLLRCLRGAGLLAIAFFYFRADVHLDQTWVWGPTGIAVGAALFLLGSSTSTRLPESTAASAPSRRWSWFIRLSGNLSYELYLFHMPIFLLLKPAVQGLAGLIGGLPRDVTFAGMAVILTYACWLLAAKVHEPAMAYLRGKT